MYFSKKAMERIFSAKTLAEGEKIAKSGHVIECRVNNYYYTVINALVQDGVVYRSYVRYSPYAGQTDVRCTCKQDKCAHAAAACFCLEQRDSSVIFDSDIMDTDSSLDNIIRSYVDPEAETPEEKNEPVSLVPQLKINDNGMLCLALKIGRGKTYVVRNITELAANIENNNVFSYGKALTFRHSLSVFDPMSRKLAEMVIREVRMHQEYSDEYSDGGLRRLPMLKNQIVLRGRLLDELFDLYNGNAGSPLNTGEYDPELLLGLRRMADNGILTYLKIPENIRFIDSGKHLYGLAASGLCRTSKEYRDNVLPLIRQMPRSIVMSKAQAAEFVSCVLPAVKDYVELDDPSGIAQKMMPDDCTPRFYFDWDEHGLSCRTAFIYGNKEIAPNAPVTKGAINRNRRVELSTDSFISSRMSWDESGRYYLQNEDAILNLLTDGLEAFRNRGEVMISDRLRMREMHPTKPMVGISLSDGMLTLDMDTGGFPPEELEDLYASLIMKRRWHKLKDGRYLQLGDSGLEPLAEAAHMSRLDPKEMAKGKVTMPAFRSLWLDQVFSGEDLRVTRNNEYRKLVRSFKTVSESDDVVPQEMNNILRGYQETGFRWLKTLERSGFGGILADEMGLGKTLQTIAYLSTVTREQTGLPSLIVCPASLILNWADEFKRFAPNLRFETVAGTVSERAELLKHVPDGNMDVLVTSYDLLKRDISAYDGLHFHTCVLDEGQYIKNQSTKGSQSVKRVNADHRFVLTGTPIENRLSELWNLFDFIMPGYLYSHSRFVEQLERPVIKSGSEEARKQLSSMVQPFLLRRMKKDVLRELPPKMEYTRRIPLSEEERKLYAAFVQQTLTELTPDSGKMAILAALTRLRQICCTPSLCVENYTGEQSKLEVCVEMVKEMTENGHQILLFSQFTSMLALIREKLTEAKISTFTLQGDTPREERARLVKEFNQGSAQVFLISLKAGGTGLNLTAADVVIHYDPWWNAAAQNQATDRAHRIGQKNCVEVYQLIAENTVEEKIRDLQEKKAALLDQVTVEGGDGILSMSSEDLLALMA